MDISVPAALAEAETVQRNFRRGLLTEQEQNERVIEICQRTTNLVADQVKKSMDPDGNLAAQASSGPTTTATCAWYASTSARQGRGLYEFSCLSRPKRRGTNIKLLTQNSHTALFHMENDDDYDKICQGLFLTL